MRNALSHVAHWHRVRAVRDLAEKARLDIFDVDAEEVRAVIDRMGDDPYRKRLAETLAELEVFA